MTNSNTLRLSAVAALMCSISPVAMAQDADITLDPITVLIAERAQATATTYEFSPAEVDAAPVADGGELLDTLPGVSLNRMGGHGADIIIRGQQANQINVIDAGSITYGGCPNRMDPPTSTMSIARADTIIVERGYSSVTHGSGGTGGTVILEREAPAFEDGSKVSGTFATGYNLNGNAKDVAASVAFDLGGGFYAEASAEYKDSDDYEAGDGREERSAYTQKNLGLTLGYAQDGLDLALDIEHDEALDVLFAGAGMDSPSSITDVYRVRGSKDVDLGALTRIEGSLFLTEVDHVMDNYSLRPNGGMYMRVPTTSDTFGGKIEGHFDFGSTTAKIGVDHQSNSRNAIAYGGMAAMVDAIEAEDPSRIVFGMWPDVTIAQTGLYGETETALSEQTTLKFGLRYDHVRATADRAADTFGSTVPNTFYTAQYGTTFDEARTEDNFSGLARIEHNLSDTTMVFAGLSRSVRTADANERAMARSNWVGNPDIAPEKHSQFDIGVEMEGDGWGFNAVAYADRVTDYILRDQFTVAGVTTYRNVSADLAGIELNGMREMGAWTVAGNVSYTYGHNRTDDQPLAQMPPLEGAISAAWEQNAWTLGGQVNFAAAQDRIDASRDGSTTEGWATLDLFGSYAVADTSAIKFGVDNVFDKAYYNHVSRSNTFDTTVEKVMEPGRSFYVKFETTF
ncbi:TonB-dependent receptor domain-containing protein [Celeribacter marinus]|uniref:TonB-dependent receptor domain-containing protein n=1 Tax=Celeribacter marinus TaxID=1397108 RepID=UPI003F6AD0D4